jgi:S1-C subfamily serine protease
MRETGTSSVETRISLPSIPSALNAARSDFNSDSVAQECCLRQRMALKPPLSDVASTTTVILSAVHTSADLPPGIRQVLGVTAENTWLQTTAAIAVGSSGSPLVEAQESVIGVNRLS